MKKYKSLFVLVCILLVFAGCKKKDKNQEQPDNLGMEQQENLTEQSNGIGAEEPVEEEPEALQEEDHTGQVRSKLTGEWVSKEIGTTRPYAIMFNNINFASPQGGTSEAAILYEAIVEGGITRMMGIFEQLSAERIGSVRSARHYFVSFADEYDAIYVHFGQTKYATAKIKELGIDNLSGLSGIGTTVFFRDSSIKAPHNAFASADGILEGTKKLKYRTELKENMDNHFTFNDEDTELEDGLSANKVTLNFSEYTSPYLTYNDNDKLYYRYQFGDKHIDKNTKEQLSFKNIIVQFVKEWNIDKNGYQTMDIENSSGKGYYITDGKLAEITWKKNESTKKMHYYDDKGNILSVNPGKTYIAIFPSDRKKDVEISE